MVIPTTHFFFPSFQVHFDIRIYVFIFVKIDFKMVSMALYKDVLQKNQLNSIMSFKFRVD